METAPNLVNSRTDRELFINLTNKPNKIDRSSIR